MKYQEIFDDYRTECEVSHETIQKYEGSLPTEWLDIWRELGFGTFMNGFFRIINPEDYQQVLKDSYYDYLNSTPIMISAFGDLIVWVKDDCAVTLFYDAPGAHVLFVDLEMFFFDLEDREYFIKSKSKDGFMFQLYEKALAQFGVLEADQCFGFKKLVCEGGKRTLTNLAVMDTRTYMNRNIEANGGVYEKPGPRWKKADTSVYKRETRWKKAVTSVSKKEKDKNYFDGKDHSGLFEDFNFKLIVIEALLHKKEGLRENLELLQEKYGKNVDAYQIIPEVANYVADLVLTQIDLNQVEELSFDGGNIVYQILTTEWDGEDSLFDVTSIKGFEKLSNLRKVFWSAMCEQELLKEMEENGIIIL